MTKDEIEGRITELYLWFKTGEESPSEIDFLGKTWDCDFINDENEEEDGGYAAHYI